jgi:hypothetical protein
MLQNFLERRCGIDTARIEAKAVCKDNGIVSNQRYGAGIGLRQKT